MISFLYKKKRMFMASSSSGTYQSQPDLDETKKNIGICIGTYSGSDSNYAMHKANCFDLMVSTCSVQWNESCDLYVAQSNPPQAALFRQATKQGIPLSSRNSCRLTSQPNVPTERIVMGMNSFLTEDDTTMPTSCYQSTFLEHKKREWLKQLEYEQRIKHRQSEQVQRQEKISSVYSLPHPIKRHIDLRDVRISQSSFSPSPSSPQSSSPQSSSPQSSSPQSSSPSPQAESNSPQAESPKEAPATLSSLTENVTENTDFYSSITKVVESSCNKTCDVSKFV